MVEKAIDIKAKANLQSPSESREINSRYWKGYRPSAKKDKEEVIREDWDGDKDKAKPHNPSPANNQLQIKVSKKSKCPESCQSHSSTGLNATKVSKMVKDTIKDLSYIKCYTYKQRGYYANKCLEKPKN